MAQSQQPLSSKEHSLFRTIVKNYESKQYKKGLKTAEQILKKNPNNGDTQAMKALLMNSLGQQDEAFALAKIALKNGMKSHTCWHVYGLLWRSVRDFEEAIKAYKFALKLDPENQTIQRDLALMQVQTRDFQGYVQSRKQILQAKPALRQNWTAMAVAHHLAGELSAAERLLTTYEETLKSPPPRTDIEHAEALLYKNSLIAESGDYAKALEHLATFEKRSLDRTTVLEMKADYLLALRRYDEAEKTVKELLDRNGEYRHYYEQLEKALELEASNTSARKALYEEYAQKDERLDAPRRIPLDFLSGNDFREAADQYLSQMFQRRVPSTFNNVKALYRDSEKLQIVEQLVEGYASKSQTNGTQANGDHVDQSKESALYFLAQHYNYKLCRNLKRALEITEQLIEMSPSKYDYVMTKARILKHQGDIPAAAEAMNKAREMDLRDRYINTKCAKYQLRNLDQAKAVETLSKFTKNDVVGGTVGDLRDMQSVWFLTEDGRAFAIQGKLGRALKRFNAIYDIFNTWEEDQFDFHGFSLRKGQVRAYIAMIRWEDGLRSHPFFTQAAIEAIKIYIQLHDTPELAQGDCLPYDIARVDDAERKKALKKAKKEHDRAEKEGIEQAEADKRVVGKKGNIGLDGEVKKSDEDRRGARFVTVKDPLNIALKFLNPLVEFGEENLQVQRLAFEVYIRRKKYFLALKSVLNSLRLSPQDSAALQQTLRLLHALSQEPADAVDEVVDLAKSSLPDPYADLTRDLNRLNDEFLASDPKSALRLFAFIRAKQVLRPADPDYDVVVQALDQNPDLPVEDVLAGIALLKEIKAPRQTIAAFVHKASRNQPSAKVQFERAFGIFDDI